MGLLYNYENYLYRAKRNKIIKLDTINIQIEKEYSIPEEYIIKNIYVANNIIYANTEYQLYIIDITDGFIIETKTIDYGINHVIVSENDNLYIVTYENTIEKYQELIKIDDFDIDLGNYGHLIKCVIKGPYIYTITESGYIIVIDIELTMMLKVVKVNSIDNCIDLFVNNRIYVVCKRNSDTVIIIYDVSNIRVDIIFVLQNLGDDIKCLIIEEELNIDDSLFIDENFIIGGFNYIYNISNNSEYQIEGYVEDIVSKQNLIYCITNNPKNFLSFQLEGFRNSNKIYAINDVLEFEEYYSNTEDYYTHNLDTFEDSSYEEDDVQQSTTVSSNITLSDNETNTENCINDNLITLESYTQEDEPIMVYVLNSINIFEKAICTTSDEWNNNVKTLMNIEALDNEGRFYDTEQKIPINIMCLATTPNDNNVSGIGSHPTKKVVIKLAINQLYITLGSAIRIKQEYNNNKIWYALPFSKRRRITNIKGIIGTSMNHGQIPGFVIYKLLKRDEIKYNIFNVIKETELDYPMMTNNRMLEESDINKIIESITIN